MAIPDFLEPAVKDYAEQAKATYSAPIDTDKFTGRQFVVTGNKVSPLSGESSWWVVVVSRRGKSSW